MVGRASGGVGGLFAGNRYRVELATVSVSHVRKWKIRTVFDLDRSKGKNAQIVSAGAATRQARDSTARFRSVVDDRGGPRTWPGSGRQARLSQW